MEDPWGALLDEPFPPVRGADDGPLAGATFVAKDLFDVAGLVTGAGQPTGLPRTRPAEVNAPAVQRLLDGGATLVGRAHTAQMAYSLSGRDDPYGMPVNPAAPAHDTGGSSSGTPRRSPVAWPTSGSAPTPSAPSGSRPRTAGCSAGGRRTA